MASVLLAVAAVAVAFAMQGVGAAAESPVSRRGLLGLVTAFVGLSVFHLGHEAGPPWLACLVMVASLVIAGPDAPSRVLAALVPAAGS